MNHLQIKTIEESNRDTFDEKVNILLETGLWIVSSTHCYTSQYEGYPEEHFYTAILIKVENQINEAIK